MSVEDEEFVEQMIADLRKELDADPGRFTQFERDFIASVEDQNDGGHLSARQREVLEEIHGNNG
jgi:hypothetical protein